MKSSPLEIEIDFGNSNLAFRPLKGRSVRGAFNVRNIKEVEGQRLLAEYPDAVPGQRIGIDPESGTGYITEPLHADQHRVLRTKIRKRGYDLPAEREEFKDAHVPTWLYWIKRAVDSGMARVVIGKIPDEIEGTPDTDFITRRQPTSEDHLAAALNRQTLAFEQLAAAISALAQNKR